jgi:hypothetical protein
LGSDFLDLSFTVVPGAKEKRKVTQTSGLSASIRRPHTRRVPFVMDQIHLSWTNPEKLEVRKNLTASNG